MIIGVVFEKYNQRKLRERANEPTNKPNGTITAPPGGGYYVSLIRYLRAIENEINRSAADVAGDDSDECSFECAVEGGINDRIDYGRSVAEPQERLEDPLVHITRLTDTHDEVYHKERRPTGDERRKHHADHTDGLAFGPHDRTGGVVRRCSAGCRSSSGTVRYRRRAGVLRSLERRRALNVGDRRHRRHRHVAVCV